MMLRWIWSVPPKIGSAWACSAWAVTAWAAATPSTASASALRSVAS
jgi:hypothetical protein